MAKTETLSIRRRATTSSSKAMASLAKKYPGYEIISFSRDDQEDGNSFYSALIQKVTGDEDGMGMPITPSSENQVSAVADAPEVPEEKEESHGGGLEEKLDKILHMLEKMVGPVDEMAEEEGAEMMPEEDDGQMLPPPAKEPLPGVGGVGGGSHLFSRYITVVRDNSTNVKMAAARKELEAEFGPKGYKVVKMARKGDQLFAGLGRKEADKDHPGFNGLVHKLEDEGKSEESAENIAGAINNKYVHHHGSDLDSLIASARQVIKKATAK